MFNTKNKSGQLVRQLQNTEFYRGAKQHWFQGMLLIGLVLLILKKDVQIQLSLSNANPQVEQTNQTSISPVNEAKIESTATTNATGSATQFSNPTKINQLAIIDPSHLWNFVKDKIRSEEGTSEASVTSQKITKEIKAEEKKKTEVKKTAKSSGAAPVGNTYSCLTFVFSPTYAQRKGIPKEEVEKQLNYCRDYISRFAPVAISERKKYGVPASIKLAQALLESNAGKSRLSRENNNHFGIKCFSRNCSKGHCGNFTDDSHKDFFRKYPNTWESYRAHSLFLQGKRYAKLKQYDVKDYRAWANGLRKAGYATDKKYAKKLIRIIEFFNLDQLDA